MAHGMVELKKLIVMIELFQKLIVMIKLFHLRMAEISKCLKRSLEFKESTGVLFFLKPYTLQTTT